MPFHGVAFAVALSIIISTPEGFPETESKVRIACPGVTDYLPPDPHDSEENVFSDYIYNVWVSSGKQLECNGSVRAHSPTHGDIMYETEVMVGKSPCSKQCGRRRGRYGASPGRPRGPSIPSKDTGTAAANTIQYNTVLVLQYHKLVLSNSSLFS